MVAIWMLSGTVCMTTWANAVVKSGRAGKFHGEVLMLSSWYKFYS